jgi:carbonic anhydrase
MITDTEPGELFHCRVVGNLVPAHGASVGGVASAIEYAVTVLEVDNVVICGHSDCGAMRAFLHPEKLKGLRAVSEWLEHAQSAIEISRSLHSDLSQDEFLDALTRENVVSQLGHLKTHPSVATRLRQGNLHVFGWHYQIEHGVVTMYDDDTQQFYPLDAPEHKKYRTLIPATA